MTSLYRRGLLLSLAGEMDILSLGRETAQSLGLPVKPLRLALLALAAALAGAAVSFAGLLGFVGLVISVPLTAVVYTILKYDLRQRLPGKEPQESEEPQETEEA